MGHSKDIICPFCGNRLDVVDSGHGDGSVSVFCDDCGVCAGHYRSADSAWLVFSSRSENADFLPCPLCGGATETYESIGSWVAKCRTCAMDMTSFVSKADLKAKWNRRAYV